MNVHIYTGDCTTILTRQLLPTIQYKDYTRALCLLDPYGLHLDWEVMLQAGRSKAVDLFLNFPVMDMNRNAIWRNADKFSAAGIERMTKFWGDESWKQAAYAESPQGGHFGPDMVKQDNDKIVAAFRKRLKEVAGFNSRSGAVADEEQRKCGRVLPVSRVSKGGSGKNHQRHLQQYR